MFLRILKSNKRWKRKACRRCKKRIKRTPSLTQTFGSSIPPDFPDLLFYPLPSLARRVSIIALSYLVAGGAASAPSAQHSTAPTNQPTTQTRQSRSNQSKWMEAKQIATRSTYYSLGAGQRASERAVQRVLVLVHHSCLQLVKHFISLRVNKCEAIEKQWQMVRIVLGAEVILGKARTPPASTTPAPAASACQMYAAESQVQTAKRKKNGAARTDLKSLFHARDAAWPSVHSRSSLSACCWNWFCPE